MRTLIIGDIHGCFRELSDLIEKFGPTDNDQIYSVGDVINRGPESINCIKLLKELNAKVVMGNHEHWYLRSFPFKEKTQQNKIFKSLELEDHLRWIYDLPYYIETPKFIIVHAGFDPRRPIEKNDKDVLVSIRMLEDIDKPWFEEYEGKKHVYFGHWGKLGLYYGKNVTGLDTGCVYGKQLSGIVVEENKLLQIKAKKVYCTIS
ncbi:MAG: metallophosphoesterase [Candidatus Delongbacteria bacterium]|nr:metallophosphoesterase [Candidatus Delongbacteria bacterium]